MPARNNSGKHFLVNAFLGVGVGVDTVKSGAVASLADMFQKLCQKHMLDNVLCQEYMLQGSGPSDKKTRGLEGGGWGGPRGRAYI